MKKYLILILLFISLISNAQNFRFGIIAEPTISWFKTDISQISGDGSKLGINIGLLADKYFAEHYAFSSGISLHSMGGILKYRDVKILRTSNGNDTLTPNSRVQYNLQYIHIPFALKFKTTEIGYITYFAELGLDAMVNIKARAKVKELGISDASVNDEINFLNLGYHIGAGIEYNIVGNTAIIGGISYMNGFADVTDDTTQKTLLHCLVLKLGVIF